jgi:hypothetical protein
VFGEGIIRGFTNQTPLNDCAISLDCLFCVELQNSWLGCYPFCVADDPTSEALRDWARRLSALIDEAHALAG